MSGFATSKGLQPWPEDRNQALGPSFSALATLPAARTDWGMGLGLQLTQAEPVWFSAGTPQLG